MRIAIVKLSALGDIVHAMVALQFIKTHSPDIAIDWVVEERFAEILQNNPHIAQILTVNLKGLKKNKLAIFSELKKIRHYANSNYDLVIDAQGLVKSAIVARLLGKKVAGFDKHSIREKAASWFYQTTVNITYHANTIDRNAKALSEPLGFAISPLEILNKQPFLFSENKDNREIADFFTKTKKNIIFVIGSTWESRNYPAEKFVAIAKALQENCLIPWGNEQEKIKADWMAMQCDNIKVLPKLDLNGLKSAMAIADLVIGNDTGPTHMAWGLNKPSITIFGPTPVSRIYQTTINKAIKSESTVNPYKLNKQDYTIRNIGEIEIIDLAKKLLSTDQNLEHSVRI